MKKRKLEDFVLSDFIPLYGRLVYEERNMDNPNSKKNSKILLYYNVGLIFLGSAGYVLGKYICKNGLDNLLNS